MTDGQQAAGSPPAGPSCEDCGKGPRYHAGWVAEGGDDRYLGSSKLNRRMQRARLWSRRRGRAGQRAAARDWWVAMFASCELLLLLLRQ